MFSDELDKWIPLGWEVKSVEETLVINPSLSLPKGTIAPHIDMKALPTTGYSITDVYEKPYSGGVKFQNGDVLLARITPCLENGKTAIVDCLDGDEVGFGSTEFIVLRGKEAIKTPYITCLSRLESFRSHCIQSMVGSSGRQRVQNMCFSNYYLSIPNNDEIQCQFHKIASKMFERISMNTEQIKSLAKCRDTLLPKLLSGKIRIEDAEGFVGTPQSRFA